MGRSCYRRDSRMAWRIAPSAMPLCDGRMLGPQPGKLRAFGAGSGGDLGERLGCGLVGLGRIHRGSPLDLVRLWRRAAVTRRRSALHVPFIEADFYLTVV